ncbi:MAG: response regulator [Cellulomonadaceae bacterium]
MTPPDRTAVVIEDDADIRELLETVLSQGGFAVHTAANGAQGVALIQEVSPLVITLDVSLPDFDGFEVARRVRAFSDAYIVMLTAHADEIDTLMGLDAGADDYLTKPFRPRELRARIEAMLRRPRQGATGPTAAVASTAPAVSEPPGAPGAVGTSEPSASGPVTAPTASGAHPVVANAPSALNAAAVNAPSAELETTPATDVGLRIDVEAHRVFVDGKEVVLTRSEFEILAALADRAGRVVSKSDLVRALWRDTYDVGTLVTPADHRSIEVHVANLRRKIGDAAAEARFIDTVRGVGYRFRTDA